MSGGERMGGMTLRAFALGLPSLLAMCCAIGFAQAGKGGANAPQQFVACNGWHALCSASTDCRISGDKAYCDCWRVNETHIVETDEIQDPLAKRLTQSNCTDKEPCDVDEAPICNTIRNGQYRVDNVRYDWVSTFSYRGWCGLLKTPPKACDQGAPNYKGDRYWAICDVAPCIAKQNPADPDRPLSCQCRIQDTPFLGTNGSCTGDRGGIMSSSPLSSWDFRNNTYRIALPGIDYVQSACARLQSDPFPRR